MSVSDYIENKEKDCGDVCPGVIQSHGGNVYEHSVWSAMQVKQWSEQKNPLMHGVDIDTAMVSALLHDIGKGGDCIKYCDDVLV
jgi:HD superfamily phosphodiesterase